MPELYGIEQKSIVAANEHKFGYFSVAMLQKKGIGVCSGVIGAVLFFAKIESFGSEYLGKLCPQFYNQKGDVHCLNFTDRILSIDGS